MTHLDLKAIKAAVEKMNKAKTIGESMEAASELGYLARNRLPALLKEVEALRAGADLLQEADRRIAWESLGFGNDFSDKVEAFLATLKPEQEAE